MGMKGDWIYSYCSCVNWSLECDPHLWVPVTVCCKGSSIFNWLLEISIVWECYLYSYCPLTCISSSLKNQVGPESWVLGGHLNPIWWKIFGLTTPRLRNKLAVQSWIIMEEIFLINWWSDNIETCFYSSDFLCCFMFWSPIFDHGDSVGDVSCFFVWLCKDSSTLGSLKGRQ